MSQLQAGYHLQVLSQMRLRSSQASKMLLNSTNPASTLEAQSQYGLVSELACDAPVAADARGLPNIPMSTS
ncbi:uncharacterized protein N7458_006859 [Penicillium daleae]|uniref:Uncharacterized protein n=1 Tax=Penicillium daleae TaxID=63821 RepID=A0AAD6C7G0_9EURO|nr:uncharacterized protein N7458_006859 [Penicillium daleae]KAJ5450410.1 hypothetical protein N7458_006859 [Penicillium daleae]